MIRRSFLTSVLALSAPPAIVRADSLMRMISRDTVILSEGRVSQSWYRGNVYADEYVLPMGILYADQIRALILADKYRPLDTIEFFVSGNYYRVNDHGLIEAIILPTPAK